MERSPLLHPQPAVSINAVTDEYVTSETGPVLEEESGFYFKRRWIIVILGFVGLFVIYAFRVVLSVAIIPIVKDKPDWDNESTRGLILSSFFWGYIITQLPGGWMAKRYGGKVSFSITQSFYS